MPHIAINLNLSAPSSVFSTPIYSHSPLSVLLLQKHDRGWFEVWLCGSNRSKSWMVIVLMHKACWAWCGAYECNHLGRHKQTSIHRIFCQVKLLTSNTYENTNNKRIEPNRIVYDCCVQSSNIVTIWLNLCRKKILSCFDSHYDGFALLTRGVYRIIGIIFSPRLD